MVSPSSYSCFSSSLLFPEPSVYPLCCFRSFLPSLVRGRVSIFPTISFPSRKHRNSQKEGEQARLSRSSILYYAPAPPPMGKENSLTAAAEKSFSPE